MSTTDAVRFEQTDGIAHLVMDDPDQSANTMNQAYQDAMEKAVNQLLAQIEDDSDSIQGVIVSSDKKTFFAGGDLHTMVQATPADAESVFKNVESMKATLRKLETCGKPVVAAINGAALGGGLEIALACHRRIAMEGRYKIGLPEVSLGLLPGGGGVTRLVRMFGLQDALMQHLLEGQQRKPGEAKEAGLVDETVSSRDELFAAAKAWIGSVQNQRDAASQPWDQKGYKVPGGTASSPKMAQTLPAFASNLRKETKGAPYRAPRSIMSAAVEGAELPFETATRIESRYLVDLIVGQQFKNMTQAFFFDLNSINAGGSRPDGIEPTRATKLAVLGAGMMGAGIAYVSARAGIDVVLKDVSSEAAENGKAHAKGLLDKQVSRRRMDAATRDEVLDRIHPSDDYSELAGCDFVVEAVFESVELKHRVFGDLEQHVNADALLGSNTSTLPITSLAEGVSRPDDFIGIHFFSPVDKMPLVEIIAGKQTGDEAIARAMDYARQINKTPIVVNDSRGFFTSRVFGEMINEGAQMLGEGVNPITIERAASLAGFPGQPLAMIDEVTLTLPQEINAEAKRAAEAEGKSVAESPAMDVLNQLVDHDRKGKATGAGFYEYPSAESGQKKYLWPGLWDMFVDDNVSIPLDDIKERLTFIMSIETIRCLEENVLRTVADANIGSIMGIGFPPLHGGALQYVNGYEAADGSIGIQAFCDRADELAEQYGQRFTPPAMLREKAAKNETFG